MIFIILGTILIPIIFAAISFPNLILSIKSKLPQIKFSKWFKNPKIKIFLQDREYFNHNANKLLTGPMFVVLGSENYKIYNILVQPDTFGNKKNFGASEDAFDIIEYNQAKFVFLHPNILKFKANQHFNTRLQLLVRRICKVRRQTYIDGVIIFPNADTLKKDTPSKEMTEEINFCADTYQKFSKCFHVKVPLYFITHDPESNELAINKNIFRHNPGQIDEDLYFGFLCDFSKKTTKISHYTYFQNAMTEFVQAFNIRTSSILHESSLHASRLDAVHTLYHVKIENFYISKNFISYFFSAFNSGSEIEFGNTAILNSVLFASSEGSTQTESIKNVFLYLAINAKDKITFSTRFLNARRNINILLSIWTLIFIGVGSFLSLKAFDYLTKKRILYIRASIEEYQNFANDFNKLLSNKFPFSQSLTKQNADFTTIAEIIKKFQNLTHGEGTYFYENIERLTRRTDIENFVNDLKNTSQFFRLNQTNMTPTSATPQPFSLAVSFDYRVNQQKENLAYRIVDWSLNIGNRNYGSQYRSQQHTQFIWTYGDSLLFRISFFEKGTKDFDSQFEPLQPNQNNSKVPVDPSVYVQENTVVYSYLNNPWSLLKFVEHYSTCQKQELDCSQGLLQFTIPLVNSSNAIFFCDVELFDEDGKHVMLPHFPTVAPLFGTEPSY